MEIKEKTDKAGLVEDYIRHTMGTENHYLHWDRRFKYTDGVKYVADTCGAHWLIDAIASHQPAIIKKGGSRFQVWQFEVKGSKYLLSGWTDTPGCSSLLAKQTIEYTDFPAELMPFEFWVESGVLLLPAEH